MAGPSIKNLVLRKKGGKQALINTRGYARGSFGRGGSHLTNTKQKSSFWKFFKSRPELNAPVSARVNDTIKEVEFTALDGSPLGRNKTKLAKEYWLNNMMIERFKSIWFDALVTGDGFGFDAGVDTKAAFKEIKKKLSSINTKSLDVNYLQKAIDEDTRGIRVFDYVASSTMIVDADAYDVQKYIQRVNGAPDVNFTKEEILHFKLQSIDGSPEGYTPVSSMQRELILIYFIKENMIAHLRNGGVPRKIFSLKDEDAGSVNHDFLTQQIQTFGAIENQHGSLVLTGDIDIKDLDLKLRDMEYEQLARYIMSNIAYGLQIPASRLPYSLDKASGGDAGGLSEAGYWSMIESDQRYIELIFNSQLGKKLGFHIKFKKPYKIDDVRETQVMTMKADAIQKLQTILKPHGKKLSVSKIQSLMGIEDSDIEELSEEEKMLPEEKSGLMNQNLLNNNQVMMSQDQSAKADSKRTAAVNNPKGADQSGN